MYYIVSYDEDTGTFRVSATTNFEYAERLYQDRVDGCRHQVDGEVEFDEFVGIVLVQVPDGSDVFIDDQYQIWLPDDGELVKSICGSNTEIITNKTVVRFNN